MRILDSHPRGPLIQACVLRYALYRQLRRREGYQPCYICSASSYATSAPLHGMPSPLYITGITHFTHNLLNFAGHISKKQQQQRNVYPWYAYSLHIKPGLHIMHSLLNFAGLTSNKHLHHRQQRQQNGCSQQKSNHIPGAIKVKVRGSLGSVRVGVASLHLQRHVQLPREAVKRLCCAHLIRVR